MSPLTSLPVRPANRAGEQRDWLVLGPEICTIRPPEIIAAVQPDDPDLRAHFLAPDAYADQGGPGCFLYARRWRRAVQEKYGWDDDRAMLEYMRMAGAAFVSGQMTFYSADPDVVPQGFQLMTGECGNIPAQPAIRQSHDFLIGNFDTLVRFAGEITDCVSGAAPDHALLQLMIGTLSDHKGSNAWLSMELQMIAVGAGWYELPAATTRGTPRPPFCHYQ